MKKKIGFALALLALAGVAYALTVTLTGPATYADKQWRSVCFSNRPLDPATGEFVVGSQYVGMVEVCPSTSNAAAPGSCSTSTRSAPTLPSNYQTFVNGWITYWIADHPGF